MIQPSRRSATLLLCLAALLGACGGGTEEKGAGKGKDGRGSGPTQVGFVVVQPTTAAVTAELSGRTVAFQSSDVRPQVTGVVQERLFEEGSFVRRGQPLYRIDPSLYRAATNEAAANLQSARANQQAARTLADRYRPLAEIEAVSRQDLDNAVASARQASAQVAQTQAQLETARINLRFTTVPAPISGRIGRSLFTVGALVSASQANPLAQIQQLDPMFVDIQQSSAELLALRRALATDAVVPTRAQVRLRLEDGSDYGYTGSVEFSEAVVDPATGTVTLRVRVPNPNGLLLPGMFVRAVFSQALNQRAFLVPQRAVQREPTGEASVFVVGPGNKAVRKAIRADRTQGASWVVTEGLAPGDRVITQGTSNLRPGAPLRPVAATAPQRIAPPAREGDQGSGTGADAEATTGGSRTPKGS